MNTLWRKAVRDLTGERTRSASIVLALALGIAGFFAVLSSYAILTRAMNEGYLASNPPSATLHVDRLDDALARAAEAVPGVAGAEARRSIRGRIRTGPSQWRNLRLFARRDFAASRIGTVSPQRGTWPPRAGEIAIERDALQVARAQIGDVVTVRTEDRNGTERPLRLSGSVHDVGQAQARMENLVYGYVTLDTLASLGEEPYYDELALRVAERPLDEAHIREVASAVARAIEANGRRVLRIDVPEPGQHPHAKLMGLLLLSMAGFGGLVLALSGAIVFNVLTALLAGQRRQIGAMKALGGTRLQIARVYLLEAGLLGAAAIAVALPIGLVGGRWLCAWLAALLNFDVTSHAVPAWVYGLVVAVGIAVPIIAAALPVWLAARMPVREALAPIGSAARVGSSLVDRALARVGGPSRLLLLAVRNAARNRLRVSLTLVTLAASGAFFMSALDFRLSMMQTLDRLFETRRTDLSLRLASSHPIEAVERAALDTEGVSAAEAWVIVDAELAGAAPGTRLGVVGLPAASRLMRFDLSRGDGLAEDARAAVVNTTLFEALGRPALGDELHLRIDGVDASLRLTGVTREPLAPAAAYLSRAFFGERSANSLQVVLANASPASLDAARTALDQSLERANIRALETATKAERRFVYDEHMVMIYAFLVVVACILGAVGGLGLATTIGLNVAERRREMGVLRAIGATPARVVQIVVLESMAVGALAWLVATLLAWASGRAIGELLLGMMFRTLPELTAAIDPKGILIWWVVSIVGSGLAGFWPARRAARSSVRDALTYD